MNDSDKRVVKTLRLSLAEAEALKQLADQDGRSESNFLCSLIRRAAKDRGIAIHRPNGSGLHVDR